MSFLKLLSTGKALVTLKPGEVDYRLNRQGLLPNFRSGRNPFARKSPPVESDSTPPAPPAAEVREPADPQRPSSLGIWRRLGVALTHFRGRFRRTKAATTLPEQRLLTLEKVRVRRNDLNSDDVELILGVGGTRTQPTLRLEQKPRTGRVAWAQLSARVFGLSPK